MLIRLSGDLFDSAAIRPSSQRNREAQLILNYPLPIFGSPPDSWTDAGRHWLSGAGGIAAVGIPAASDRPLMAIATGGALFVLWFAKPHAKLVRRYSADRLARKLAIRVEQDDFD